MIINNRMKTNKSNLQRQKKKIEYHMKKVIINIKLNKLYILNKIPYNNHYYNLF